MEPVFLVNLLRAKVMACCFNASVAAGFDLDVRGVVTLCVNVGSDLRKTPGTWYLACGERMCLVELISELIPVCLVAVLSLLMLHGSL